MKIITLCILFLFLICIPAFPQPQPYFGSDIVKKTILIEITYLNGKKEEGFVLHESDKELWILTEKGIIGIRLKEQIFKIDVLKIRAKGVKHGRN